MSIGLFKSLAIPGIAKKRGAVVRPAFSQNYMGSALPSGVTFSRASNATQFDAQGRLCWAPHNLCSRGNMASGWAIGGEGTLTTLPGALPSGRDGFRITTTVASPGSLTSIGSQTVVVGATHAVTVKVRYSNHPWIRIGLYSNSTSTNQVRAWFNMQTGVVGTVQNSGTATGASFDTPIALANGWWQLTIRGNVPFSAITDGAILIAMATADLSTTRPGIGSEFDVGEPLLEVVGPQTPQTFTQAHLTAGAAYYGQRADYNPATLASRGTLFEDARTNLSPNSNSWNVIFAGPTIALNAVGPSGLSNSAYTFTEAVGINQHIAGPASATVTAAQHAVSVFVKAGTATRCQLACSAAITSEYANFSLAGAGSVLVQNASTNAVIQQLSNGWFRISMTPTMTAGTGQVFVAFIDSDAAARLPSYSGTGLTLLVAEGQIELGGFASSIIPTFGTTATRSGDVLDNIGDLPYSAAGITAYADFERMAIPPASTTSALFYFGDTGFNTGIIASFGFSTPAQQRCDLVNATVQEAQLSVANGSANVRYRWAARFAPNDARMAQNGALGTADITVNMPASIPTGRKAIGRANSANSQQMWGWLRELRVYTTPLADATLQALTS